ncbi:hypothetical protein F4804DRAFT_303930, partial [Jackrogersella minutella]
MLRLLRSRLRPNPFTVATRVHASTVSPPQVVRIQRVRIRQKWFKPRNFVIAASIYYICYRAYKASIFKTVNEWVDEQDKELTKKERKELEEGLLDPMFIPIPFTTRAVLSEPYRGSDPEWKTFIKISKNQELGKHIRNSLASMVCKAVSLSPLLSQRYGKNMTVGKYWLDIQYPYRPPPTFVHKGLTIGDDVSITEEPIDTTAALWVQRALWPSTLTLSLWSFSGALLKQNALNFAKIFGYEPNPSPSPSLQQTIEKVHQRLKKPTADPDSKAASSLPSAKTQAAGGSSTDSTSPVEKRSTGSSTAPGSPSASPSSGMSSPIPIIPTAEPDKPKSARDIYGIRHTQEHTSGAWAAFKQTFRQTWRPIQGLPPRGSIYVSGLVEINTPRAFIIIDAFAFWDPKTETFDIKTMSLRLRTIRMKTQSPA